jgi:hypothetical protein
LVLLFDWARSIYSFNFFVSFIKMVWSIKDEIHICSNNNVHIKEK